MKISAREMAETLNTTARGIDFTSLKNSTSDIFTKAQAAKSTILGKEVGQETGGIKGLVSELMTIAEQQQTTLLPIVAEITKDMPGAAEHLIDEMSSSGITRIAELDSAEEIALFASAQPLMTSASSLLHDIITDASPESLGKSLSSITGKTLEIFEPAMQQLADSDMQDEVLAASQELIQNKGVQDLISATSGLATSFASATGNFFSGFFLKDLVEHKTYNITNTVRGIVPSASEGTLESVTNKLLSADQQKAIDEAMGGISIPFSMQQLASREGLLLPKATEEALNQFVDRIELIDPTNLDLSSVRLDVSKLKLALEEVDADVSSTIDNGDEAKDKMIVTSRDLSQPKAFSTLRSKDQLVKYIQSCSRQVTALVVHWSGHYSDAYNIGAAEMDREYTAQGFGEQPYHFVIKKNGDIQTGVSINLQSAHTYDEFRPKSVSVCFVAGYNETKPSDGSEGKLTFNSINRNQIVSFNELLNAWYTTFPGADVFGQNDLDNNESISPGFDVRDYVFNRMSKRNTCEPTVDKRFLSSEEMVQRNFDNALTQKIGIQ